MSRQFASSSRTCKKMIRKSLPTSFVRGGTSNGLIFHRHHLPADPAAWQPILASAMGSPDSYGRQLNGMGSGASSTSKVCVVEPSKREGVDVDFTFVQVGIKDGRLDLAGNCGNMSSIVGPWAVEEGIVPRVEGDREGRRTLRVWNTNTNKIVEAEFEVAQDGRFEANGDYAIDGVPGTASKITLSFLDPGGAKTGKALPTGNSIDVIEYGDGKTIKASLIDVANPGVFVAAADLGLPGDITPSTLEADSEMMARLEQIRQAGAAMMGLDTNWQTIPKVVLVSPPRTRDTEQGINIVCRALSMQQPHKAVPLTLALNLGTACRMPGTIPNEMAKAVKGESVTLAHASGKVEVGSVFEDGQVKSALLLRTARIMMKGEVYYDVEE